MITDEEIQKRMEYMQDFAGWKSIIFLPFQFLWQCVMMISVVFVFATSVNRATYKVEGYLEISAGYFCDFLYFVDTLCSIFHHALVNTRKLKNYKSKSWILIMIDIFSLIPVELIYVAIYLSKKQLSLDTWYYMFLNRIVRIYRIHYYFKEYEMSFNSLRWGILLTSLQLYIYSLCINHIATAMYHMAKTEEELKDFGKNIIQNIFIEEVNMYFLFSQRFIGVDTRYNTIEKRIYFSIIMIVGFFYIYGITVPKMMFAIQKTRRPFIDFRNRFKRLTIFINNVIEDEVLEKKILKMFQMVWIYGKGEFEPELLATYPLNMRKNTYADIYWDALRHSDLLQNVSRSCKRSLALKIIGNFYEPGTIFWNMNENKNIFVYLASGILQIMAVENKNSPIISFSGGTVLGESSLFYPDKSKAILRVATFSEIHVLEAQDFFRVIKDYPKDRKIIQANLKLRLQIARTTQLRRKEISTSIFRRHGGELQNKETDGFDSVKWVKSQFRHIAQVEERRSKNSKSYSGLDQLSLVNYQLQEVKAVIDHTSVYLPLLNLGEEIEVITDQTCLKTTLPWVLDPNSPFIRHWRYFILFFIVFTSSTYPMFIGWWPVIPQWLNSLSIFISIIYLWDIFIHLSTAIKTKDEFIAKSGPIFRYRVRRLSFYADVISALPHHTIFHQILNLGEDEDTLVRLTIAISLMKVYRLIIFLEDWSQTLKGRYSLRIMLKYFIYTFLLIYWTAAFLQLSDVRCLLWGCDGVSWYKEEIGKESLGYQNLASVSFAASYVIGTNSAYDHPVTFPSAIVIIMTLTASQFIALAWAGEFIGAYLSEKMQQIQFKALVESATAYMNERKIAGRIMKRVWDTMKFQWVYDCGDYLTQKRAMLEDLPLKLKSEVNEVTIFKLLKSCQAFESESDDFIWYLCRRSVVLVLPAGSIVLTFGTQSMTVYAVYKGCLEVNSFLPKDIIGGITTPAFYGPGKIVPIVIALNQMPSSVTVRALTDCQLIAIPLEILLTGLLIDHSFKDFVDAIKDLDLQPFIKSRLVFSRVAKFSEMKDENYQEPFRKLNWFGWLFKCFLLRRTIRADGRFYFGWESFRIFAVIFQATVWPFVFTLPPGQQRLFVIYPLMLLESFSWFDFYVKMHVGYYNKKGIHVSHPLSTLTHYIGTSLLLELIVFLPYLHSIYIIVTNQDFDVSPSIAKLHCITRALGLYRVFIFAKSISLLKISSPLRPIGIGLILYLGLNCFMVLKISLEVKWIRHADGTTTFEYSDDSWIKAVNVPEINNIAEMYITMFYCVLMIMYRGHVIFQEYSIDVICLKVGLTIFGIISSLLAMVIFLSHKTGSKMNFIVYQYHMKSLRNFLKEEQADDAISMEAITHFEHEWEKRKGDDLHAVFKRFPNILYEDMTYPIYRNIFLALSCFKNANDGFFRSLSRTFAEVHFRKRSVISFENAVHADIYFIFNGLCYVADDNVLLGEGSIMGDIKGNGKMITNIRAQTHVVLLTITSQKFFNILNNYAETEAAYFDAIKNVKDYVKSTQSIPDNFNPQDVTDLKNSKDRFQMSQFEIVKRSSLVTLVKRENSKKLHKKKTYKYINPNSRLAKILLTVFILDAIITAFFIPIIMAVQLRNIAIEAFVHFLDAIWYVKIITSFRTAFISPDTGNLVTDKKIIHRNYLKSVDGFLVDILCVIPFEYIDLITSYIFHQEYWLLERFCYIFRLLRLFSLWIRVKNEKKKLSMSDRTKWIIIIVKQLIIFNFLVSVNLIIATDEKMFIPHRQSSLSKFLVDALIWSFLSVLNLYAGTGLYLSRPTNLIQIIYHTFISFFAMFQRNSLVAEVLAIIQASLFVKFEKLYSMQSMKEFIEVRNISSSLKKTLMSYACDLLIHFNGEVEPWFLKTAPYYIRVEIMQDLYLEYLRKCSAFRETPLDFLKQLAARLQRHVYFPRDVITEKGDVDCCMYFVHNGEVVGIESDPIYHGLDYETKQFGVGDYFGLEQGLSQTIPQSTTYRALTRVDLLILNYYEWRDLRLAFPEVKNIILNAIRIDLK